MTSLHKQLEFAIKKSLFITFLRYACIRSLIAYIQGNSLYLKSKQIN